ncbi:hypothetical protein FCK90_06265 [Kocuria coralli]|uniref:Cell division protein FtsL n=1 Tax=Kocuria coralli TaxID=1461025 RepID=A0A5J5KYC2_9MICC|nr:hypothetical protein [Kocuria coralli]KAA9394428.1 hypothetical protein FCK90_06265 [Kocuria coralli]
MTQRKAKAPSPGPQGRQGRLQRLRSRIREARPGAAAGRAIARRRWSKFMPIVVAVMAIIATLTVILLLNVRISDGQYRLVELRAQERSLAQEAEALTQDLEFYQAPQNLARAASDEGMVSATSEGVVDLTSDEVTGDPEPAAAGEDNDVLVDQPVQRGSAVADRAAALARERRDALPETQAQVDEQLRAANDAESEVDLHGGSIPAPQQRTPSSATATPSPSGVPTGAPAQDGDQVQDDRVQDDQAQDDQAQGDQAQGEQAAAEPAAPAGGGQ